MLQLYPTFASDGWDGAVHRDWRAGLPPNQCDDRMPRGAQQQIELFPDLPRASARPRGGSGVSHATSDRARLVQGSAPGGSAVGSVTDSRQEADPDLWFERLVNAFEHLQ